MQLRTLGGLRLEGSSFSRPKPLLLLAHLALEGPQNRRHLAELFWPEGRDHMKSLTVALTRLRSGAPGAVDADDGSAWATVETDAERFLELVEEERYEEALGLYGGAFLEGIYLRQWSAELEEWVYRTREVLAAHAQRACLELGEREAAEGRFREAARFAKQALDLGHERAEPHDLARMHGLLVAGRSSRAPEVRREAEELGVPLVASEAEARERFGPGRPETTTPPRHLPTRGTAFVGREQERRELHLLLACDEERLLTVVGTAGVGKSRLAVTVAQEQHELGRFADGVHLVSLETLTSTEQIAPAIGDALGLDQPDAGDAFRRVREALARKEALLVLDGFEHLVDGSARVGELLRTCPRLKILATSRERLDLEEERIVPLTGLPRPHVAATPDEALRHDAVQLFVQRARRAAPGFELDAENVGDVLEICRLMEGLPLGLELSAAWVRALPPREIAAETARDLDLLTTRTRDVPVRHRSLRGAFEHSWRLLSAREQEVLRRLSVFRGGFRRAAAREVSGATIAVLASLVDKSLLRVRPSGRYDLHPLLHQYAREKLAERGEERERVEAAHARHFLGFLRAWGEELAGGRQREALAAIEEDLENVHAAWRWATRERRLEALWEGCRPLQLFYIQRGGLAREGARAFSEAADHLDGDDPDQRPVLGRLRVAEGWFWFRLGANEASERAATDGVERLRAHLGQPRAADPALREALLRALASGVNTLGNVFQRRGELAAAESAYREALELAVEQDNAGQSALFTNNLALLEKDRGAYGEAERLFHEALTLNRARRNQRSAVRNLTNLGAVKVLAGEPEAAERVLEQGLSLAREIGYEAIVPHLLLGLGGAAHERGELARARDLYAQAMAPRDVSAEGAFEAQAYLALARLAVAEGGTDEAHRNYLSALAAAWASQDLPLVREVLVGVAELHGRQGEVEDAANLLSLESLDEAVHAVLRDPAVR